MKRKFFTHNFLSIIAIFMFVLFTLTTSCFASVTFDFNGTSYFCPSIDEIPEVLSEFKSNKYFYALGTSSNRMCIYLDCSPEADLYWDTSSSGSHSYLKIYFSKVARIYYDDSGNVSYDYLTNTSRVYGFYDGSAPEGSQYRFDYDVCATGNFDIILDDGTVVFQAPPLEKPAEQEIQQVELMKPTQVEEIPAQIVEIVKIVLPIFLTIFGILLVLYLIKSKNLLQL